MRSAGSSKYQPQSEWATHLRERALEPFVAHDLNACLEVFRQHNAFYAERLAGVSAWTDAQPLAKTEIIALAAGGDEPTYDTRTSGTSGFQVTVRNNNSERRFRQALAYRPFLFYPLKDKVIRQVIFVDGNDVDAADKQQWPFEFGGSQYSTWRAGIAAPPERIRELLRQVRPQVLRGMTSGIVRFADAVNTRLDDLGVQVVSPSGEHLLPEWRELLTESFAAPVLDRYGSTETGSLAWQCPYCDDYHANSDEIIIEATANGLLATPLFIESQPLLRYSLGDQVALHTDGHDCRIRLPRLEVLEARRDDWIIDGKGQKVSPLSFQLEQVEGLKAWRMQQLESGDLRLYFEAGGSPAAGFQEELLNHVKRIVPGRPVELVDGVWKLQRPGKFKRVISDMQISQQR